MSLGLKSLDFWLFLGRNLAKVMSLGSMRIKIAFVLAARLLMARRDFLNDSLSLATGP